VIRRFFLTAALAFGLVVGTAGAASAANVVCAYNVDPLNIGVCVGV
jgi:hypothetical protein